MHDRTPMPSFERAPSAHLFPWAWLIGLALAGVLVRVLVLGGHGLLTVPDSSTYITAARDLVSGDFSLGQGRRTPGYPLLIAALGENLGALAAVQMGLGIAISLMLFGIAFLLTRRPGVAFAAGLSYHLNLQQLFLEGALMTETLTTALVVLMALSLVLAFRHLRAQRNAAGWTVLAGVAGAMAILVRPQFLFLPLLLPPLVAYAACEWAWPSRRAWAHAALVALPSVIAVLGWAAVLHAKTGHFAMSTQSGMGLVNHSIEFIEEVPAEYAQVRDILLKYRAAQVRATGHSGNTVWYALPEIRQATGWTLPEASRELQKMSMQLFAAHPLLYVRSVLQPWLEFWTVPIFWDPGRVALPGLSDLLTSTWQAEHLLLRMANAAFLVLIAAVTILPRVRRAVRWNLEATTISAVILASSLLQAMADRGAGSRYAVTVQALLIVLLIVAESQWRVRRLAGPSTSSTRSSVA